jgi:hypothetical protein
VTRGALLAAAAIAACDPKPPAPVATPVAPPAAWPVPAEWKSEIIPFPLGFAPGLAHRGLEELRFPPGFNNPD